MRSLLPVALLASPLILGLAACSPNAPAARTSGGITASPGGGATGTRPPDTQSGTGGLNRGGGGSGSGQGSGGSGSGGGGGSGT